MTCIFVRAHVSVRAEHWGIVYIYQRHYAIRTVCWTTLWLLLLGGSHLAAAAAEGIEAA